MNRMASRVQLRRWEWEHLAHPCHTRTTGIYGAVANLVGGVVFVALGILIITCSRVDVLWSHTLGPLGRFFYLTIARAQASANRHRNERVADSATRIMIEARQWNVGLGILFMFLGGALLIARFA